MILKITISEQIDATRTFTTETEAPLDDEAEAEEAGRLLVALRGAFVNGMTQAEPN